MNYRKFGNTDLVVSEIGFGAWAIGGAANVGGVEIGWGPSDDAVSLDALAAALDHGINFFDTADFYGLGHSEELLGSCLGNRDDVVVATKVGQKVGKDGKIAIDYSKEYILNACEQSLTRLKRSSIDFYQLHVARLAHLEKGDCIEAMETLQSQGKIRYWGISLITAAPEPEANYLLQRQKGNGFQLALNLINQLALPVLKQASAAGCGVIVRMPLQFGLLSGQMRSSDVFHQQDHRSYRLTPSIIQAVNDVLRTEILPLAKQYNTSLSSFALSFLLAFPEVSVVIPGIRKRSHVVENTTGLVQLSANDHTYLQGLFENRWKPVLQMILNQG
jgi:aryl-alcohol dehydrogenase-like predicted oxidoreductase